MIVCPSDEVWSAASPVELPVQAEPPPARWAGWFLIIVGALEGAVVSASAAGVGRPPDGGWLIGLGSMAAVVMAGGFLELRRVGEIRRQPGALPSVRVVNRGGIDV